MKSIAFVGAHSSGKSTLINACVDAFRGDKVKVISGLTRAIINRGFPLEKNSNVDSYTNYIRDQLKAERKIETRDTDLLFSDRTVIDAASYALVNSNLPRPFIPKYFVEMLLEIAILEAQRFNLFVYCPVEFPIVQEDFRPIDEQYRQDVGLQVKDLLEDHNLQYIVASGDVATRLSTTKLAIDEIYG